MGVKEFFKRFFGKPKGERITWEEFWANDEYCNHDYRLIIMPDKRTLAQHLGRIDVSTDQKARRADSNRGHHHDYGRQDFRRPDPDWHRSPGGCPHHQGRHD